MLLPQSDRLEEFLCRVAIQCVRFYQPDDNQHSKRMAVPDCALADIFMTSCYFPNISTGSFGIIVRVAESPVFYVAFEKDLLTIRTGVQEKRICAM